MKSFFSCSGRLMKKACSLCLDEPLVFLVRNTGDATTSKASSSWTQIRTYMYCHHPNMDYWIDSFGANRKAQTLIKYKIIRFDHAKIIRILSHWFAYSIVRYLLSLLLNGTTGPTYVYLHTALYADVPHGTREQRFAVDLSLPSHHLETIIAKNATSSSHNGRQ